MKYYLFLDESGDHGLIRIDSQYPIFVLTGIVISHEDYLTLGERITNLKNHFWPNATINLHSTDIRKWQKGFEILMNEGIRQQFYEEINSILSESNYTVIASAIRKEHYVKKYGVLVDDVYEVALSHILERTYYYLRSKNDAEARLSMHIEKRGKKEDKKLASHIQKVFDRGTYYIASERFKELRPKFFFHAKAQCVIGLEVADLAAYPIARHIMNPNAANPPYAIVSQKFYNHNGNIYGLKIHP